MRSSLDPSKIRASNTNTTTTLSCVSLASLLTLIIAFPCNAFSAILSMSLILPILCIFLMRY